MLLINTTTRYHHSRMLSPAMFFMGLSVGMIGQNFHPILLVPCLGVLFYLPEFTHYLKNGELSNPGLNYLFYKTRCFPKLLVVKLFMGIIAGATVNYFIYADNNNAAVNSFIIFVVVFILLMFFTRKCIR